MKDVDLSLDLDAAMLNSYHFIMGLKDLETLIDENPEALLLVFDPDEYDRGEVIKDLMDYFEGTEDYELCANLKALQ